MKLRITQKARERDEKRAPVPTLADAVVDSKMFAVYEQAETDKHREYVRRKHVWLAEHPGANASEICVAVRKIAAETLI